MDINELDDETYLKLEKLFLDKFIKRFDSEIYRKRLESEIDKLIYSYLKESLSDIILSKMGVKFSIDDIRKIVDESINKNMNDIRSLIGAELHNKYNIKPVSINDLTNQINSLNNRLRSW